MSPVALDPPPLESSGRSAAQKRVTAYPALCIRFWSVCRAHHLQRVPLPAAFRRRLSSSRALREEPIGLAGVFGAPVRNEAGQDVGQLVDLLARVYDEEEHAAITGLVLGMGEHR